MKTFLKGLVKVLLVAVLLVITAAAVLYIEGYYDFTFIDRHQVMNVLPGLSGEEETVSPYQDAYTAPRAPGDNLSLFTHPEAVGAETEEGEEAEPFRLLDAAEAITNGWIITDTDYDRSTHIITERKLIAQPKASLNGQKTSKNITDWSSGSAEIRTVQTVRRTLEPYMGWVIYDDGAMLSLMDSSGIVRLTAFDAEPVWFRDSYGRPLFRYEGALLFATDSQSKVNLYESAYNPLFAPALKLNASPSYGTAGSGRYQFYLPDPDDPTGERILWGYVDENRQTVIEAQYEYCTGFGDEGLACVAGSDRILRVIDKNGHTVIFENGPAERAGVRKDLNCRFIWPVTDDESQRGQLYFDHGYMRVTESYTERRTGEFAGTAELLISADGSVFDYPSGYTLKYYSYGVLVLEKEGKYGMMDIHGNWIAQPIYTYVTPFCEGLAVIGFEDGKKCMVDTEGNILLPFEYEWISECGGGLITAWDGSSWHLMSKMAKPK